MAEGFGYDPHSQQPHRRGTGLFNCAIRQYCGETNSKELGDVIIYTGCRSPLLTIHPDVLPDFVLPVRVVFRVLEVQRIDRYENKTKKEKANYANAGTKHTKILGVYSPVRE
jgi:hypothetical protein